jgi:RNA polymerase sigma-70 factor, ECF subfamily
VTVTPIARKGSAGSIPAARFWTSTQRRMHPSAEPVTQLLIQWRDGNRDALADLTTLLYRELRAMAQQYVRRERMDHTIQGTALVNEAFMRLVNLQSVNWQDRKHFFSLASTIMRRILVDHARARLATKRGGDAQRISNEELEGTALSDDDRDELPFGMPGEALLVSTEVSEDINTLDQLLSRLEALDSRQAQIVEMRYFGGLTIEQTAQALGISDATVKREWTLARAWLKRELTQSVS